MINNHARLLNSIITILLFVVLSGCSDISNLTQSATNVPTKVVEITPTPTTKRTATSTLEIPTNTPGIKFEPLTDLEPGLYLAYWVDTEQKVYVTNMDGSLKQFLIDSPSKYVSLSPDNQKIAISSYEELSIYDLVSGEKKSITTGNGIGDFRRTTWSPDGNSLVFSAGYKDSWKTIIKVSLNDMIPIPLTFWETVEDDPSWSPDGKWIAFGSDQAKRKYEGSYLGVTEIYLMNTSCFTNPETCDDNLIQVTD